MGSPSVPSLIACEAATAPPHVACRTSTLLAAGGTTRCPGFRERLYAELRPLVPDDYEVGHWFGPGRGGYWTMCCYLSPFDRSWPSAS